MYVRVTEETFNNVKTWRARGFKAIEISKLSGLSQGSVSNIHRSATLDDYRKLIRFKKYGQVEPPVQEKMDIPQEDLYVRLDRLESKIDKIYSILQVRTIKPRTISPLPEIAKKKGFFRAK